MSLHVCVLVCFLIAAVSPAWCAEPPGMQQKLAALLARKEFSRVRLGVSITDADGKNLFSLNDNESLVPASNQKLVTGACGLLHFGPGYRFTTRFYRRGRLKNGVLQGDLVVRGGGAIAFTARYVADFDYKTAVLGKQLDAFAARVKSAGVSRIAGCVVVDAGDWSGKDFNRHYPAAGSVTFNENAAEIRVANSRIRTVPDPLLHFELVRRAQGRGQEKMLDAGRPTDRILINTASDSTDYWRIDTISAEDYYRENIVRALSQRGIAIDGGPAAANGTEELLFELEGLAVSDYVRRMFTDSDNVRAELLFLNLGRSLCGKADYDNAIAASRQVLIQSGILPAGVIIADGSGLSRENRIRAGDLTRLLRFMNAHASRDVFRNSLAVSGVAGTIKDKLAARELTGRVHAKSGGLDGVATLAGFAETGKGEAVFSFLANNVADKKKIWKLFEEMLLCLVSR